MVPGPGETATDKVPGLMELLLSSALSFIAEGTTGGPERGVICLRSQSKQLAELISEPGPPKLQTRTFSVPYIYQRDSSAADFNVSWDFGTLTRQIKVFTEEISGNESKNRYAFHFKCPAEKLYIYSEALSCILTPSWTRLLSMNRGGKIWVSHNCWILLARPGNPKIWIQTSFCRFLPVTFASLGLGFPTCKRKD